MERIRYPVTIDGETAQIGTAGELAIALDVLQGQRDRQVLEQLRPHLADIIATPQSLSSVLKSLAPDDQIYLIEALGYRLAGIVQGANHLRDVLALLVEVDVEERLLDTLGPSGLRRLILTAQELAEVLEWIYGECDQRALDLLGTDHLQRLLHDGHDLSLVLGSLDETRQGMLIERLGWDRVVRLVRGGRDLAYLIRALPAAMSRQLLDHYSRPELIHLIGNERDWAFLWQRLEAAEAAYLCTLLGVEPHAE